MITSFSIFSQTTWKSLDDIPKKWIKLEKDKIGYLVSKPCKGKTPIIEITDNVTIYWQLKSPEKFPILKFTRLIGNKAFYIYAGKEFTAEIINGKKKLVLWTFGENKWIMTPFENRKNFRQINDLCP